MDRFVELVKHFHEQRVRFVIIGVWGANYWAAHAGQIFMTLDRDLFMPLDVDNELRAWKLCWNLGCELWGDRAGIAILSETDYHP